MSENLKERIVKKLIAGIILISIVALASGKVYIVSNGKKYHRTDRCRTLSRSKNIRAVEISNVGGRTPCKVCH